MNEVYSSLSACSLKLLPSLCVVTFRHSLACKRVRTIFLSHGNGLTPAAAKPSYFCSHIKEERENEEFPTKKRKNVWSGQSYRDCINIKYCHFRMVRMIRSINTSNPRPRKTEGKVWNGVLLNTVLSGDSECIELALLS